MLETIDAGEGAPPPRKPSAEQKKVSTQPVPRVRRAKGTGTNTAARRGVRKKKRWGRRIFTMLVIAAILGPSGWLYWQQRQDAIAYADTVESLSKVQNQLAAMNAQSLDVAAQLQKYQDREKDRKQDAKLDEKAVAAEQKRLEQRMTLLSAAMRDKIGNKDFAVAVEGVNVRVSLRGKRLFDGRTSDVTDKGRDALRLVADAAKEFADRNIILEGHSDKSNIANERYGSKWELAAQRAINVLYYFQYDAGIGAGRMRVTTLADNERTKDSRWDNDRIDIVFVPRADKAPSDGAEKSSGKTASKDDAAAKKLPRKL